MRSTNGRRRRSDGSTAISNSIDSPVGKLTLAGKGGRLMHLRMVDQTYEPSHDGWEPDDEAFPEAVEQLEAYFAGDRTDFDLELDLVGTAVSAAGLGGAADDSLWGDAVVRRDRPADRIPRGVSRRRVGEWPQPDRHHRAVPSRDRVERQPHRVWRRARSKKGLARIGEKPHRARAIRLNNAIKMPLPSNRNWRAEDFNCVRRCPTFPPGLGSIIGAGRLSFRVRDGSGRFPAAMYRRNFIHSFLSVPLLCWGWCYLVVGCSRLMRCGCCGCGVVCKFSAG